MERGLHRTPRIGTDFVGHFALTGLLLPRLTDRVVTLSSLAHRIGGLDTADLDWGRRRYQRRLAYRQSKLADLMFAYELQRRFAAAGSRPGARGLRTRATRPPTCSRAPRPCGTRSWACSTG